WTAGTAQSAPAVSRYFWMMSPPIECPTKVSDGGRPRAALATASTWAPGGNSFDATAVRAAVMRQGRGGHGVTAGAEPAGEVKPQPVPRQRPHRPPATLPRTAAPRPPTEPGQPGYPMP